MEPIIFSPDQKYLSKLHVVAALVVLVTITWWVVPGLFALGYDHDGTGQGLILAAVALVLHLPVMAVIMWLNGLYYRSIRYEIHEDEVVVYAGIITKSVKHVPFRTVTNLKMTRGPVDRLFGLGTLAIQTAGMSGTTGAEESLAGLTDVQQVYEQVARELRRFRSAMSPTQAGEELAQSAPSTDGDVLNAILEELRAIRAGLERE